MPQVDLTSVCAGVTHDNKVACETLAGDSFTGDEEEESPAPAETQNPDYAPESFWLSKDAELDWLDRNAFLDRKDSGKGSNSNSTNLNPVHISAGSQRYSTNLKSSKASLIALPKPQKQNYAEVKNRRHYKPSSIRLFPKRSDSVGRKPVVALSEPGSPKVSCMGRVRSRKDRNRRGKNRSNNNNNKKVNEPGLVRNKSVVKDRRSGFWKNIRSIFRLKGSKMGGKADEEFEGNVNKSSSLKKKRGFNNFNSNNDVGVGGLSEEVGSVGPPGLGGMKRFASGRKSDGWAGDVEFDGAKSEPLDPRGPIWRRREAGPPVEIEVDRDWRVVGPISV
ncbi:hypothetical protein BVRB_7g159390 [Beta vulgaris subsp. vulgaris]|nr:hypothetical protein BVRB_7g159390 [Beta vulgaris subsp. vulgaris]